MLTTSGWVEVLRALIDAGPIGILVVVIIVLVWLLVRFLGRTQQLLEHIVKRLLP